MNWQPIETIPRDGSWVMIYDGSHRIVSCDEFDCMDLHGAHVSQRILKSAVWMPFPEPPVMGDV